MYFYGLYCGTLCVWEGCACVGEGRWVVREREHREHSDDDDVEPFLVLFLLYFVSTVSVCVCLHCSYVFFGISGKLNFPPLDIKLNLFLIWGFTRDDVLPFFVLCIFLWVLDCWLDWNSYCCETNGNQWSWRWNTKTLQHGFCILYVVLTHIINFFNPQAFI